jgi:hypothetical protein
MKILVANIPLPGNRFLADLNDALAKQSEVHHSSDTFWDKKGNYDIVHLHFPEYLTFELQDAYKNGLVDELIDRTAERLEYWANRAKLIVTRHVLLPHDALRDPMWEKMYETFYRFADGVVHFAQASIDEFRERYRETSFHRGHEPSHTVVPHHNYASLPNKIDRAEARRRLGLPAEAKVMLTFGAIRNDEERKLILDTFHGIRQPHKVLLVSRWREKLAKFSWIRLKYWIRDLTRLYYKLHPSYHFNYAFVQEDDTQLFLQAADVLFIPRLWVLNSGNVTLGMTFGRVVVGPNSWDVGELLRETGNPVFDPDRPATAVQALEEGFRLAAAGEIGSANQKLALEEWGVSRCADLYLEFFRKLI